MVSFQAPLSPKNHDQQTRTVSYLEPNPSKKRRWDDHCHLFYHHPNKMKKPSSAIDLQLETPLPLEWQRCLDIQSGEIHFYNTKTKKRTIKDPRKEVQRPAHLSLDLELNLSYGDHHDRPKPKTLSLFKATSTNFSSTSPVVEEAGEEEAAAEMVAAACKKCHMLVVLCKSSPSCPNCKFMHPLDETSLPLNFIINPELGLSC